MPVRKYQWKIGTIFQKKVRIHLLVLGNIDSFKVSHNTIRNYLSHYQASPSFQKVLPKWFKVKPSFLNCHLDHQTRIYFFAFNLILICVWWEAHQPNPLHHHPPTATPWAVFKTEFGLGWGRGGSVQPRQQGHMLQVLRKNNGREIGKRINWREETCFVEILFLIYKTEE